jgi:hypothetical protein
MPFFKRCIFPVIYIKIIIIQNPPIIDTHQMPAGPGTHVTDEHRFRICTLPDEKFGASQTESIAVIFEINVLFHLVGVGGPMVEMLRKLFVIGYICKMIPDFSVDLCGHPFALAHLSLRSLQKIESGFEMQ